MALWKAGWIYSEARLDKPFGGILAEICGPRLMPFSADARLNLGFLFAIHTSFLEKAYRTYEQP